MNAEEMEDGFVEDFGDPGGRDVIVPDTDYEVWELTKKVVKLLEETG